MKQKIALNFCFAFIIIFSIGMTVGMVKYILVSGAGDTKTEGVIDRSGRMVAPVETLRISLPKGTTRNQVQFLPEVENRRLRITLTDVDRAFLSNNPLENEGKKNIRLQYAVKDNIIYIDLLFEEYFACEYDIKSEQLVMFLYNVRDYFDTIVVVDPLMGGEDTGTVSYGIKEADVNLKFAKRMRDFLMAGNDSISDNYVNQKLNLVVLTRSEDVALDREAREDLIRQLKPNILVALHCMGDGNTRRTKGMRILRDDLAQARRSILYNDIPEETRLVEVELGYLTNYQEAQNLIDEKYIDKIAQHLSREIWN